MADITQWKDLLSAVPGSVWAGLFGTGAVVALFTQWRANRHALRTQRIALDHDAHQRERERQISLRREIYLPALDAMTGLMQALGKLADLSASETDIAARFADNMAPLWRVQMTGGIETIRSVSTLQRKIGVLFLESLEGRMPLTSLKTDLDIAERMAQKQNDEVEICVELMKEYNIEGRNDKTRWEAIQQRAQYAASQRDTHGKTADDARNALIAAHISNVRVFAEKLDGLKGLWGRQRPPCAQNLEAWTRQKLLQKRLKRTLQKCEAH